MDADRWRRLRQRFDQALDAAPETRAALLAAWRVEDAALAAEIERLLAAEAQVAPMAVASPAAATLKMLAERAAPALGTRVGPWQLDAEIGAGGMGRVYRATRSDGAYDQAVAIKLLRGEALNPALLRRFSVERQVLARLDHPGIARLIDASTLEDGTPYVVMELVAGEPLLDWCDARRASIETRLRLFRRVLDAVAAAHRALVVHRDLKSSNILVTGDGEPKLLDFGIAKPLASSPDVTATAERFFTPATAAPEQLRGEPVTVAVDVYALGLLLYELLCGKPAVEIAGLTAGQAERRILEEVPPPMSTRIGRDDEPLAAARGLGSAAALRRRLVDDLDPIAERCLRKEPAARYLSVEQLAADIDNALSGRPVSARAGRRWYRVRKFLARNRRIVAASAAFAFVVASAMTVIVAQALAIAEERDRATLERDRARAVVSLLKRAFEAADPSQTAGAEISARDVLVAARPELDGLLDDQPELYADLAGTIAEVELSLGLANEAYALVAEAEAATRERVLSPQVQGELLLTAARAALAASRPDDAERLLARLPASMAESAAALGLRGLLLLQRGQYDEAIASLQDAVTKSVQMAPSDSVPRQVRLDLANALRLVSRYDAAIAVVDEMLAWQSTLPDGHPDLLRTRLRRATLLRRVGRIQASLDESLAVLNDVERIYGSDSAYAAYAHRSAGSAYVALSRRDEALPHLTRDLDIVSLRLGRGHRETLRAMHNLAFVLGESEDSTHVQRALELFAECVELGETTFGLEHPTMASFRASYASLLLRVGRYREAADVVLAHGMESALDATTDSVRGRVNEILGQLLDRLHCQFPSNEGMGLERERLTEELPLIRSAPCVPRSEVAPTVARNSN